MKFQCKTLIKAPLQRVIEIFQDPEHLQYWQDGFQSLKHLEGEPGAEGSLSILHYKQGKRDIILKETILENDLPRIFRGRYEHEHMDNTMTVSFREISYNRVEYLTDIHYTRFSGLIIKFFALIFPSTFRKQTQKWMDQFRDHVEGLEKA